LDELQLEEHGPVVSQLREAIALQDAGKVTQAIKLLESASAVIEELPETSLLSRVLATDPKIQLLVEKAAMSSLPTKSKLSDATDFQIQKSLKRSSLILAPQGNVQDEVVDSLTDLIRAPAATSGRSSLLVASEMKQGVTIGQIADGKLSNPIPALQQKLDAVLFLCDKARIFEAANDADELELDIESIQKLLSVEIDVDFADELDDWLANFRLHPRIVKLRNIHSRLQAQLKAVRYEGTLDGTDKRWAEIKFTDPEITPTFEVISSGAGGNGCGCI